MNTRRRTDTTAREGFTRIYSRKNDHERILECAFGTFGIYYVSNK